MEKCFYCGMIYHPMPVYVKDPTVKNEKPEKITVCHFNLDPDTGDIEVNHICRNHAEKDGYTFRKDLTPTR